MLIMDSLAKSIGCLLFGNVIPILLFADDIVLISHTTIGLQQQLDILGTYSNLHGLEVNLQKIKIMTFNLPKRDLSSIHITYKGKVIKTIISYTYLGVLFTWPTFNMILASQERLNKGYPTLVSFDKQCFQLQFQDISMNIILFHTLVTPILLYGEVWDPILRSLGWYRIERILISILSKFICS